MTTIAPGSQKRVGPNPVTADDEEQLRFTSRPTRRRSRRAVDQIRQLIHASIESLAYLGYALIITDASGRVEYLTASARCILGSCERRMRLENGRLAFSDKQHVHHFKTTVDWIKHRQPAESAPSCTFFVERAPPDRPVVVSVFPLQSISPDDLYVGHVMVTLCDSERQTQFKWHLFGERYALTTAELRLCRALVDGFSLTEYSTKYRITLNTARTQLKSIFAKTSIRRQSGLLLLIFNFLRA